MKLLLAILLVSTLPLSASAKSERESHYRFEQVWPTAIRHIRIDEGHAIVDKDEGTGYVIFDVKDDGKSYRGTLELVRGKDSDSRPTVKLLLTIADRPAYMEMAILERLLAKLYREHGDEPEAPPPAPEKVDDDSNAES